MIGDSQVIIRLQFQAENIVNKKILGILILSLAAATTANASRGYPAFEFKPFVAPPAAPEIDPASAVSAFTLLAGGLAIIRGRRANRK